MSHIILIIAAVFAQAFAGSTALADTSKTSERQRVKTYGKCTTATIVDLFTDKESYKVECTANPGWFSSISIGLLHKENRLYVVLDETFIMSDFDEVDVMIRIDKGEVIRRTALWNEFDRGEATIEDYTLALNLLNQLAHGKRAVIRIGDHDGGSIRLNGSHRAIRDFRQRAGLTQQTLTPQQRQTLEIPAKSF